MKEIEIAFNYGFLFHHITELYQHLAKYGQFQLDENIIMQDQYCNPILFKHIHNPEIRVTPNIKLLLLKKILCYIMYHK